MIRLMIAGLCALWVAGCGLDGNASTDRDWPEASPALWEVRGSGGESGWLFGTAHALPARLDWRTPAVDAALERSGLLVVEIADLDDAAQGAAQFTQRSRAAGLPPLSLRVPEAERPALLAALDRARLAESAFDDVKTWAAALQLASALRRHDPAHGVDRALLASATRVLGLESFAAQYGLFDRLSADQQARLLVAVVHEAAAGRQDAMIEAWLTGDMAALDRHARAGLLADPALRERLQGARNRDWAEIVHGLVLRGERPFVAVGAAHVIGPDGLPALLEARGHEVRRIR